LPVAANRQLTRTQVGPDPIGRLERTVYTSVGGKSQLLVAIMKDGSSGAITSTITSSLFD